MRPCSDLRSKIRCEAARERRRRPTYLDDLLQPALKSGAFLDDFLGFLALTLGPAGLEVGLAGPL